MKIQSLVTLLFGPNNSAQNGQETCEKILAENEQSVSTFENYIQTGTQSIIAIYGLIVLYSVLSNRLYDFFAISIPLMLISFATITIIFYWITKFEDFSMSTKTEANGGAHVMFWVYCGIYAAFYWLCAIQFLQASMIFPRELFHLPAVERDSSDRLRTKFRWVNYIMLLCILVLAPLAGIFCHKESERQFYAGTAFTDAIVIVSFILLAVALSNIKKQNKILQTRRKDSDFLRMFTVGDAYSNRRQILTLNFLLVSGLVFNFFDLIYSLLLLIVDQRVLCQDNFQTTLIGFELVSLCADLNELVFCLLLLYIIHSFTKGKKRYQNGRDQTKYDLTSSVQIFMQGSAMLEAMQAYKQREIEHSFSERQKFLQSEFSEEMQLDPMRINS